LEVIAALLGKDLPGRASLPPVEAARPGPPASAVEAPPRVEAETRVSEDPPRGADAWTDYAGQGMVQVAFSMPPPPPERRIQPQRAVAAKYAARLAPPRSGTAMRCRAVVVAAQLGDMPGRADLALMRAGCR
jgi:hypothetical protein